MQQHEVQPYRGSAKRRKRIGRGLGSGHGAFSTRGCKGQRARTGKKIAWWFEGGQTPIHRRMPKLRGFRSRSDVVTCAINLNDLHVFAAGSTVDKKALVEKRFITDTDVCVKILGAGDVPAKLTIRLDAMSATAKKKLEAAGGTFEASPAHSQPQKKPTA